MMNEFLRISEIPAVLYGENSDGLYLFVHGKHGHKEEAAEFAKIVYPKGWQVLSHAGAAGFSAKLGEQTDEIGGHDDTGNNAGTEFLAQKSEPAMPADLQATGMVNDHFTACFLYGVQGD